ncbi:MAG: GTPase, partial [Raoultibacter sp.]
SYDKLFATLDSTTRKFVLPEGREITITDTVGFIQKLPTTLIESFKSTLDEILGADLILHVIDVSSQKYQAQISAVDEVLDQIEAQKISRLLVFNKSDLIHPEELAGLRLRYRDALFISAKEKEGLGDLVARIAWVAASQDVLLDVVIPYNRGDLVSLAHERCHIIREVHDSDGTHLNIQSPAAFANSFQPFISHV